jgi:hypothetical protein
VAKAAARAHPLRSKAEVHQDFLKIREEVAATREARNTKVEEAAKHKEAEVRQAVDGLSVEGVAQSISALSIQISKALAEVSDNLIAEVQRLATIREAVSLERVELERLHKIDTAATALDQLAQDYDSKSVALDAEMSARRTAWDAELKARELHPSRPARILRKFLSINHQDICTRSDGWCVWGLSRLLSRDTNAGEGAAREATTNRYAWHAVRSAPPPAPVPLRQDPGPFR